MGVSMNVVCASILKLPADVRKGSAHRGFEGMATNSLPVTEASVMLTLSFSFKAKAGIRKAVWIPACRTELSGSDLQCRIHITKPKYEYKYFQDGDIIIGGVFSVHFGVFHIPDNNGKYIPFCISPRLPLYEEIRTFMFAIDEINQNPDLFPNITLGYHLYDSCSAPRFAVGGALQILSGPGKTIPNYSCRGRGEIVGFIGNQISASILPLAQLLGNYGYTLISLDATDSALSDPVQYPHVFSTVPNDYISHIAVAMMIQRLRWTWVILLGDDSGDLVGQNLQTEIIKHGACVDFIATLKTASKNTRVWERIKNSKAEVIVVYGTPSTYFLGSLFMDSGLILEKTLVIPIPWIPARFEHYPRLAHGGLVFRYPTEQNKGQWNKFTEYMLSITGDELVQDLLALENICRTPDEEKNRLFDYVYGKCPTDCSSDICFKSFKRLKTYDKPSIKVYRSVYTMALALHNMLSLKGKNEAKDISTMLYRKKTLKSQCSANCPLGYRKIPQKSAPPCCYDCAPCSEGEISNVTDSDICIQCSDKERPNEKKNQCIAKSEHFLSYTNDMITVFFSSISVFFFAITVMIVAVLIVYQDTPILSFLSVFLFLCRPVDITCMLRNITFGITFSIAVSSLLAKTIMVCVAFKATKPGSSWRKWVGAKLSNSVVLFCSSIQIIICMTWLAISPPFQELDLHTYPGTIIIQCNEGSAIGFYSVIGYMGLLAAVSFVLAFLARTLPDSFNEAKYITFSMLLFCSVWITMIPAYLSTKGKNTVCVEIFAILTSSAGLLFCIFLPKCYTIFFRPGKNTKSVVENFLPNKHTIEISESEEEINRSNTASAIKEVSKDTKAAMGKKMFEMCLETSKMQEKIGEKQEEMLTLMREQTKAILEQNCILKKFSESVCRIESAFFEFLKMERHLVLAVENEEGSICSLADDSIDLQKEPCLCPVIAETNVQSSKVVTNENMTTTKLSVDNVPDVDVLFLNKNKPLRRSLRQVKGNKELLACSSRKN
ncbi:hypothetical protein XELAEV_18003449mg [Xenopus laevis]|nr:hypothetical protein XELAEV_18003449mg [Xenopus laevis]